MCAVLVLGPVRGVGEGLIAPFVFTHIRLLPRVRPEVGLKVLQAGVSFGAALKLQREEDRRTDSETGCLSFCAVWCSWLENTNKNALCGYIFKCNLLSAFCLQWDATQRQSRATMW